MQKWARMLVETGKAFVDPSATITQMRGDSDLWGCDLSRSCVAEHFLSSQSIQKMDLTLSKWISPQPVCLHSSKEVLPIRSGHCQNTKLSRSRHWK